MLEAWKPLLQFEKENFFLNLNWQPIIFGYSYGAIDFNKSTKLWITVLDKYFPIVFKNNSCLFSRDTNIRNCDIIVYSPANVEIWLHWENYNVDGFREAFDVWLQNKILLILWLLKVEKVNVLSLIRCTYIICTVWSKLLT